MTTVDEAGQATVEDVWREFESSLRAFIQRRIADPHRADDVLSEVFLRIHRRLHTVEDDERIASWVFAVARNAVTDEYRRSGRRREVLVADPIDEADFPTTGEADENLALSELASCIRPLLRYLPEHHRRALDLVDLQGVSQTEAATREEISISGMKSRVQRARRELRALIDECCAFSIDARGLPFEYRPGEGCGCGSTSSGCASDSG